MTPIRMPGRADGVERGHHIGEHVPGRALRERVLNRRMASSSMSVMADAREHGEVETLDPRVRVLLGRLERAPR